MIDLPFITGDAAATSVLAVTARDWPAAAERLPPSLRRQAERADFKAQPGRILLAVDADGGLDRVLFGLGEGRDPMLFGELGKSLPEGAYRIAEAPAALSPTRCAVAFAMGGYVFDRYKLRRRPAPRLVLGPEVDEAEARGVAEAVWFARDLVNTPPNDLGPEGLHRAADALAQAFGARLVATVGDEALLAADLPLIAAVGRAAAEPARLLQLSWGDPSAPCVALVGKGVTFDSGGLDVKNEAGMRLMKKDMGGAATALGLARRVMQAALPVRLEVFVPVVENAIGAGAMRPGDIVRARGGTNVEIDNTDAEGRLILADALARAGEENPVLTLDFATLTGAARVALGPEITPFYTPSDALAADLQAASAAHADPLWRMPLWDGYAADLESPIADLKNTGDGGFAGSIYAALFLRRFATKGEWAHFDMYAWTPKDRPGRPAGGDAQSLRAAWGLLKLRFA